MLIDTPYKVGDVVSMKLTSGEELLATLEEEKGSDYVLKKPLMLVAQQQGLGLAPFMFTASPDAKITVGNDKVVCITKTIEEMAKQYISSTTGIVT